MLILSHIRMHAHIDIRMNDVNEVIGKLLLG